MPFTNDDSYKQAIREAGEDAVRLLKDCYGSPIEQPKKDSIGRTLLGYGRDLFKRHQSSTVADLELREDIDATAQILGVRMFTMLVARPEALPKVSSLLVVADLVGPETVRDCEQLWAAAKAGDWMRAAAILIGFDWGMYRAARQHSVDQEAVNMRIIEIAMGVTQ